MLGDDRRGACDTAPMGQAVVVLLLGLLGGCCIPFGDSNNCGETKAGFVYATDAAQGGDKVRTAFAVPTGTPIFYPIAPVAASANATAASQFTAWVLTPQAQAVLAKHGFGKP